MASQIFIYRKNKNKKVQFFLVFLALFIIVSSIYAIINRSDGKTSLLPNFILTAKEQEKNTNKVRAEKMITVKKAAKGFFTHLRFADIPYDMSQLSFKDIQENDHKLIEFTGKPMLINLWAIWCVPCRAEMPELGQLKRDMSGENFDVIAINIDKTASPEKIQQFLHEVHADNLVYYRDETMNILQDIRKQGLALGLPVTLLVDENGRLIASFNGAAPWANDDAKALIKAITETTW
ncbi:thiol:disulfide interchange protein [Bartonella australis AUST/NH1]|uniref:Thiol:disulfide interchange protein n=1 Tax=Bartonella australis (strain Aust/NH1) TaxID=1094489 RepID=M1N5E9_BARAA|nr:TlpA disulfide reductase family protein [Bartonella australis]AGF75114.1 thiol:disulfide interchange protein [Bartonella australis AUST/NH1]